MVKVREVVGKNYVMFVCPFCPISEAEKKANAKGIDHPDIEEYNRKIMYTDPEKSTFQVKPHFSKWLENESLQ